MEIRLISEDGQLYQLCREILGEFRSQPSALSVGSTQEVGTNADVYIWDFHPNISFRDLVPGSFARNLFLVDRKHLADFLGKKEFSESLVLLKPVTRAALSAFLDLTISSDVATAVLADRDEILQCLIQSNLKLQEYDQDRTNFLARATHDFRAPLTALSGYCGLLLGDPLGPINEKQREVLERMSRSVERLSRLADAMYQLSVGRQVKHRTRVHKADIRDCLEQAVHEITPFANEKQIRLTVSMEPCDELFVEAVQLEQVLVNLLDNACKFTPRFGRIEIRGYAYFWDRRAVATTILLQKDRRLRSRPDPNSYRIDVVDSGAPIPTERLDQIFEEYISYGGSMDRSGSGLGLAICRMIVTQHRGRIWAENTDSGPMFSFVLPDNGSELNPGFFTEVELREGVRL